MARIVHVLGSSSLVALVTEAARHAGLAVSRERPGAPAEAVAMRAARHSVFVHDFQPDAHRSITWLDAAARLEPRLMVFPLLESPASPALAALLQVPRGFGCAGAALVAEQTPRSLGRLLTDAAALGRRRALAAEVAGRWRLDPVLAALAHRALGGTRPHGNLRSLLGDSGVGRKAYVRRAKALGFDPPLRFLHALRVVDALARMQGRRTERDVALELGYGSPDTLRRHFHEVLGITPRTARRLELTVVIDSLAPRAVSDPPEHDGPAA